MLHEYVWVYYTLNLLMLLLATKYKKLLIPIMIVYTYLIGCLPIYLASPMPKESITKEYTTILRFTLSQKRICQIP